MKTYHLTPEQLPFDLDLTLDCGQVFRWKQIGGQWAGVIAGNVVTISQSGEILSYDGINETDI
ncbi:MAG TPA: DNA glycosylase, partial [Methanospirillum sp.]|uniref:DNA glycosylase n=1 Tax=Methanospirillum sp. TaxID=45200 RepID=UPI002BB8DB99